MKALFPTTLRLALWAELTTAERAEVFDAVILDGHIFADDCEVRRVLTATQGTITQIDVCHPDIGEGTITLFRRDDGAGVFGILHQVRGGVLREYYVGGVLDLIVSAEWERESPRRQQA